MPRIRSIKPEFFESEKLGRCSVLARLSFAGMISLADDEGRGRGSPEYLKSRLHPYDKKAQRNLFKATNELALARLVRFYVVEGAVYYQIAGWTEHQRIQHPSKSKLPPCPDGAGQLFLTIPHEDSGKPHEPSSWDQGSRIRDQGSGIKEGTTSVPGVNPHEKPGNGNGAGEPAPKRKAFEPPTPDEVRAWMQEKHPDWLRTVNPVKFCAYYESNGWKVGKNKMTDWQAAVVTWVYK